VTAAPRLTLILYGVGPDVTGACEDLVNELRIGRAEVRRCLGQTTLAVVSNHAIRRLYARERVGLDASGTPV